MPSAPGKRFSNDTKVTDMLYGCYALADEDKDFSKELAAIKADIRKLSTVCIWSFPWRRSSRPSKRISRRKPEEIMRLPAANI